MASTESVKARISSILGLDPKLSQYWDIIDQYPKDNPELILVHYSDDVNPDSREHEPLLDVRGIIVDITTGAIISKAFGYNHILPCNEPLTEDDESIIVSTQVKKYYSDYQDNPNEIAKITLGDMKFTKSESALFLGGESVVVRFFKWKGQIFFSTYRKIDGSSGAWGGRAPFSRVFARLFPGFSSEMLFGPEEYSPYSYVFLISSEATRIITSIRENRILFLAMFKTWEEQDFPAYASGPIPARGIPTTGIPEPPVFSGNNDKPTRFQTVISVDIANKFIFPKQFATPVPPGVPAEDYELIPEYSPTEPRILDIYFKDPGYGSNDERLSGGDMIMIYTRGTNNAAKVYRLDAPSIAYRSMVTGDDPVPYHRFVVKMPEFTMGKPDELKETYPLYTFNGQTLELSRPEDRRRWWWSIFYDAVSPDFKNEVDGYLDRYNKDIAMVVKFITTGRNNLSDIEKRGINEITNQRFNQLLEAVRTYRGNRNQALSNMLHKETGNSLYKMIKTVQKIVEERVFRQVRQGTSPGVTLPPAPPIPEGLPPVTFI